MSNCRCEMCAQLPDVSGSDQLEDAEQVGGQERVVAQGSHGQAAE